MARSPIPTITVPDKISRPQPYFQPNLATVTRVKLPTISEGHRDGSNHYDKIASDLNLMLNGEYLKDARDHLLSGLKWESRHALCRWGGNWDKDSHPGEAGENDGNHYSLIHNGRM